MIGELVPGEAAEEAGLQPGDLVLSAEGEAVANWQEWVDIVQDHPGDTLRLEVERRGEVLDIAVTPRAVDGPTGRVGRIGAAAQVPDDLFDKYRTEVRRGAIGGDGRRGGQDGGYEPAHAARSRAHD